MFVLGCRQLIVAVDHKPLIPIFNNRELDKITNPRILKIRERALPYQFTVVSIPGKKNCGPDAVSRIPTPPPSSQIASSYVAADIEPAIIASTTSHHSITNDSHLNKILEHSATDHQYKVLLDTLLSGFPDDRQSLPPEIKEFWSMRNDLYVLENLIFSAGRPFIPKSMRPHLLAELHIGHQGVNTMKTNARQRFFWLGMNRSIQQIRDNCQRCNEIAPSQRREGLSSTPVPDYPFQKVVSDLFHMAGMSYLIYADRFSGWTEVAICKNANTKNLCDILRKYFTTFGVPEELSSDGGPPYNAHDFRKFLRDWGINHRLSSAYYPQSNGRAESAVKTMKRILTTNISPSGSLDTDAAAKAILLHRNTPPPDMGVSPAELLFGHPLRDHLPKPIRMRLEWLELADRRETAHAQRNRYANNHVNPYNLNPLSPGDLVSIQNQRGNHPNHWNATGRIVERLPHRQYNVLVDGSRRVTTRNRRFLRPASESTRRILDDDPVLPPSPPKNEILTAEKLLSPVQEEPIAKDTTTKMLDGESISSRSEPLATNPRRSTREHRPPKRYGCDDYVTTRR